MESFIEQKKINVLGSNMSYSDTGCGSRTFVFLHGIPTSFIFGGTALKKYHNMDDVVPD